MKNLHFDLHHFYKIAWTMLDYSQRPLGEMEDLLFPGIQDAWGETFWVEVFPAVSPETILTGRVTQQPDLIKSKAKCHWEKVENLQEQYLVERLAYRRHFYNDTHQDPTPGCPWCQQKGWV